MNASLLLRRSLAATVAVAVTMSPCGIAMAAGTPARHRPPARSPAHMAARVAQFPAGSQRPTGQVLLSIGEGELVTLPSNVTDVWTSNPAVADVYVNNAHQINLYGKSFGDATVFATNASGAVVYSTNVLVSQNITSIDRMLRAAMPDADIKVTTVGQIAVLTGTVLSPDDSVQAQRLVTALLNPGVDTSSGTAALKITVVNRLKTATPLQVNLQVRFAEVSKSFIKNIGVNLQNRDSGNFLFGVSQGRAGTITTVPGTPPAGYINGAPVDAAGNPISVDANGALPGQKLFQFPGNTGIGTALGFAGHALGTDLLASLDLGERDGEVTTLANPNLSALSGETATFLAGGEIPIPVSQGLGAVSVEYKQYGVSLAYTPTVLADGRISLRVRPEVSQLSSQGAVTIAGTTIPALTTRRAETTLELGSGQSMMIAGLLSNTHNNLITKAPGIGDLPILGALFRSNAFQRDETELVIVITPYLVKPVNANDIALPTDGYKAPTDLGRVFMGQLSGGTTGGDRPKPSIAPSAGAQPAFGANAPVLPDNIPRAPAPAQQQRKDEASAVTPTNQPKPKKGAAAAPGFDL